jgi:predicted DNA-binding transcriptional regulator YafY
MKTPSASSGQAIRIHYTNYKGVKAWRAIVPGQIRFGATEHHPQEQWLMDAHDVEKDAQRTFAMRDIHEWDFTT